MKELDSCAPYNVENENWITIRHYLIEKILESHHVDDSEFTRIKRIYSIAKAMTCETVDFGGLDHCLREAQSPTFIRPTIYRSQLNREFEMPAGCFEAPRFYLIRGSELGYHCHVHETRHSTDTGLLLTVTGDGPNFEVWAEKHRSGKVKRPASVEGIGKRECSWLAANAVDEIGGFSSDSRRLPSDSAFSLGESNGNRLRY